MDVFGADDQGRRTGLKFNAGRDGFSGMHRAAHRRIGRRDFIGAGGHREPRARGIDQRRHVRLQHDLPGESIADQGIRAGRREGPCALVIVLEHKARDWRRDFIGGKDERDAVVVEHIAAKDCRAIFFRFDGDAEFEAVVGVSPGGRRGRRLEQGEQGEDCSERHGFPPVGLDGWGDGRVSFGQLAGVEEAGGE